MKTIAVITGASSGLGKEFVSRISVRYAVNEIWVIARRADRLEQLKERIPVTVIPIPLDLTDPESYEVLEQKLEEEKPSVEILVNAAGMGRIGLVKDLAAQDIDRMIELNCRALSRVTKICLPYMHKGSGIIQIASVAGFQPIPGFSIYAASKAYVVSYSKTLHYELRKEGIHVTCVCPYWIKDTEFIPTASENTDAGFRRIPFAQHSEDVVRRSLDALDRNLWICTPGIVPALDRITSKVLPHCLVIRGMDFVRKL